MHYKLFSISWVRLEQIESDNEELEELEFLDTIFTKLDFN